MCSKNVLLSASLLLLLSMSVCARSSATSKQLAMLDVRFDFGETGCGTCGWFVVVDGVMGGRSSAELSSTSKSIVLSGNISLENRGGFASIRTPYEKYNLNGYTQVSIRYRSTGQAFAVTLNNNRRFYLPRFKHTLPNTDGQWSEVSLRFDDFKKMRFSEELGGGPSSSELKKIIRLGIISNDKVAGPFTLEVDYLKFE